ncbi:hypothetical protein V2703_15065, partial [Tenacibaculum maritimum]
YPKALIYNTIVRAVKFKDIKASLYLGIKSSKTGKNIRAIYINPYAIVTYCSLIKLNSFLTSVKLSLANLSIILGKITKPVASNNKIIALAIVYEKLKNANSSTE